ncbi:MAG TPA: BrnA antitoxin family protein [Candidatus Angelobacter sp.]|jgi:uncharacterized protein (DUF4415 family)|nr:BrnA antitoxin family protein [Candidatus Angelobacter sp.]
MNRKTTIVTQSENDAPEIPKMGEGFFVNAIRVDTPEQLWEVTGSGVPKQQITLRVDSDIIAFFKEQGKGYQRLMNFALRAYMLRQKSAQPPQSPARRKTRSESLPEKVAHYRKTGSKRFDMAFPA